MRSANYPDVKLSVIYDQAAELLSVETHWTREALARSAFGYGCLPTNVLAQCFCATGALVKIARIDMEESTELYMDLRSPFCEVMGTTPENFNDNIATNHMQVANALRKVASSLRDAGK